MTGHEPAHVVSHQYGSYPVFVGEGLLASGRALLAPMFEGRVPFLVTDDVVIEELRGWRHHAEHPWRGPADDLDTGLWVDDPVVIPHGEGSKTRAQWASVCDALLTRSAGRDAVILAVGGGVVGDLGGFVAATYLRGIPVIQVPTTLLAMVDASLGGKTGVDTAEGKNLVGAFHQPAAVVADLRCLTTLPDREFRAGLAEVVKHAVLAGPEAFAWLERHVAHIHDRHLPTLAELVRTSMAVKIDVVEEDEHEGGRRAHLNLGHTVAHALEQASGFALSHGEAVALGLVAECALAAEEGLAAAELADQVAGLLDRLSLPTRLDDPPDPTAVMAAMRFDKKARSGTVRFALPEGLGAMAGTPGSWTVPVVERARIERALSRIGLA